MTGRRLLLTGGLLAAMAVTATCGDDPQQPDGPTPGWVDIVLATPHPDDGGILFAVRGPAVDSVYGILPNTVIRRASPTDVRVLVIGEVRNSAVVGRVLVADTADVSGYSATVTEAAAGAPSFVQRTGSGYRLTIGSSQP